MTIDYNYKDKNKGFSELKNEILINLFFELHKFLNRNTPLSKFEIFQIECKVTDILKKLVDICNKNVFSNFNLELRMEDIDKMHIDYGIENKIEYCLDVILKEARKEEQINLPTLHNNVICI